MKQNMIQIGNSVGLIIPSELRKKANLRKGSKVLVELGPDNRLVISKKGDKKTKSTLTPEFLDWLESFNKEYGPALKELARK